MSATSNKKFKEIEVGTTVLVDVPRYDRAPLDNKNITGRVVGKNGDLYRIGTAAGIIKGWLPRNLVQISPRAKFSDNEGLRPNCHHLVGKALSSATARNPIFNAKQRSARVRNMEFFVSQSVTTRPIAAINKF